jgi:TonB family protein
MSPVFNHLYQQKIILLTMMLIHFHNGAGYPATLKEISMRKALVVALVFSPVLLHAQASSPAQHQLALLSTSRLGATADRGTNINRPLRISTGVVAPKLIHSVSINSETIRPWTDVAANKTVTVGMIVNTDGRPTDLKIVKSAGSAVDHSILDAVAQYRFQPGTVSNQPVAFPLNLEINLAPTR